MRAELEKDVVQMFENFEKCAQALKKAEDTCEDCLIFKDIRSGLSNIGKTTMKLVKECDVLSDDVHVFFEKQISKLDDFTECSGY